MNEKYLNIFFPINVVFLKNKNLSQSSANDLADIWFLAPLSGMVLTGGAVNSGSEEATHTESIKLNLNQAWAAEEQYSLHYAESYRHILLT